MWESKGRMNSSTSPEDIQGCGHLLNLECSPGGHIDDLIRALRSIYLSLYIYISILLYVHVVNGAVRDYEIDLTPDLQGHY